MEVNEWIVSFTIIYCEKAVCSVDSGRGWDYPLIYSVQFPLNFRDCEQ